MNAVTLEKTLVAHTCLLGESLQLALRVAYTSPLVPSGPSPSIPPCSAPQLHLFGSKKNKYIYKTIKKVLHKFGKVGTCSPFTEKYHKCIIMSILGSNIGLERT